TVHDTANPNGGVDAHGAYFRNTTNVSIHYCVGDGRIISSLPEGYRARHAGDGTGTQFKWLDTTITGTGTPVIDINAQGYFTINGQATPLEAPRGRSGEVLDKSYFGDLGPAWKLEGGKYYLGNTRFSTSQTARGVISNYGGNNNSIGIEMCVNTSGNIIDTWQRNAKLVADILTRHNLDTNRVKMHNTFDGKNCPSSLRQTNYWAEFMEMVEIEYAFMNEFKDVEVTMVSNTPELLTNLGGIKAKPKNTSTVSYTITVKKGDVTKSVTLSSIVPGITTWAQLNGFY
ncbi:MAG TPA: N-acetylmuramoyl-L-alanine amidase, partial [Bacilli bacterium]|nr:N-acetylmuramoyl-L-alanine amidase [Bacilli bacterium]